MELTFLGTSAGVPTKQRNVSGVAIRGANKWWDLHDCGEATQHQLIRTALSLPKMRRIFISHLHGDHCFGIFGVLASRSSSVVTDPVTVFGPVGIARMVRAVLDASSTHLSFPLTFVEVPVDGAVVVDDEYERITAVPLVHGVTSFAWHRVEADRPGRFDVAQARALGVQPGPDFARLQRGDPVQTAGGATVHPDHVMSAARPGRTIIVAGDNADADRLLCATGAVDVLVHEATFTEAAVAKIGHNYGHSTAHGVATAAERHQVRHLVLTHFSPRYMNGNDAPGSIAEIEREARAAYNGTLHLANDFDRFVVDAEGTVSDKSNLG